MTGSSEPVMPLMECMLSIGIPTSIAWHPSLCESIGPMVPPPPVSERFWNTVPKVSQLIGLEEKTYSTLNVRTYLPRELHSPGGSCHPSIRVRADYHTLIQRGYHTWDVD